jgi:hypothetical protein
MLSTRREEKQVFGYAITRLEQYDDSGTLKSRCYQVSCPRSGAVLGRQQSLRAAKRFVVMHELRGLTLKKKRERQLIGAVRVA